MRKIMFIGRSEAGKTTLSQAMKGKTITYHKTQYVNQAAAWLELAGCKKIFYTSAYTGEGIADILSYLKEERDTLPWEEVKSKYDELGFGAGEDAKDQDRFHNI